MCHLSVYLFLPIFIYLLFTTGDRAISYIFDVTERSVLAEFILTIIGSMGIMLGVIGAIMIARRH